jgi:MoaA/NifB/PqqE/SkfB family radical SAM enzyme
MFRLLVFVDSIPALRIRNTGANLLIIHWLSDFSRIFHPLFGTIQSCNTANMPVPLILDPANSMAGWYFTPAVIEESLADCQMLNASIDLTNACNLNCPYCYIEEKHSRRKTRKATELSHDETIAVIADLKRAGARTINIVGAGEPTIDPHFEETIEYVADQGMVPVIFTNGIRLAHDHQLLCMLHKHRATVVLKYDSSSNSLQDLVAGAHGYAEKRNIALQYLIDMGFNAEIPTRLGLDSVVFQGNISEITSIHTWAREHNIFPIAADFIPTGRTADGVFCGQSALETASNQERQLISEVLQPVNTSSRLTTVGNLLSIDVAFEIKRGPALAYYGGGACTQELGLYVDIEGHIWPCVARKQRVNGILLECPLGYVRQGDLPSKIWRKTQFLAELRSTFDGSCPYKPSLKP